MLTIHWWPQYTDRVRNRIHQQLAAARIYSGWSFQELLDRSKLKLDKASLIRKLAGKTPLKTEEAESLADTFRRHGFSITIAWPPLAAKRAA